MIIYKHTDYLGSSGLESGIETTTFIVVVVARPHTVLNELCRSDLLYYRRGKEHLTIYMAGVGTCK